MTDSPLLLVVLTFNSVESLKLVVDSCRPLAPRVVVVDSGSTDGTVELARGLGCEVLEHPFENYAKQRNWAQDAIGATEGWYLHLDADEVLTPELCGSIGAALAAPTHNGYLMKRVPFFMGRKIRHGVIGSTFHLRLYRVGRGRVEDRLYDQHYVLDGEAGRLQGDLLDLQITTVEKWTAAHNRWSTAEAEEVWSRHMSPDAQAESGTLTASLKGDMRMRKRWLKNRVWYRMPLLLRPFLFFFYSYVLRGGFLDGKVGVAYHVLQAFWFRFLVDVKLLERREAESNFRELYADLSRTYEAYERTPLGADDRG